ncbi:hypothetical protein ACOMHN_044687 [Nucella lapillus]
MAAFRNDVAALQFSEEDPVTDYNQGLTAVLDSHAPLMTGCVTDRPSAPWLTLEVKQSKQQRRRVERQLRKTHLVVHRQMFQQCRDDTKDLISDVRTSHTSARVEECTTSKALFNLVGHLTGRCKDKSLPNNIPADQLPDAFCDFFTDNIVHLRLELDKASESPDFSVFSGK